MPAEHVHALAGPQPRSVPRDRLPSLTGLRFAAALLVVGYHAREYVHGDASAVLRPIFSGGRLGVGFFFVLSGFVLTWSASPGVPAHTFYRRRLARIWPAYGVALVAGELISAHFHDLPGGVQLVPDLLLVQAWSPRAQTYFSVNGVSWSLSCEAFFYACFPALLPRLVAATASRRARSLALCVVAVVIVQLACTLAAPTPHVDGGAAWFWLAYISPPVRLLDFVCGMLAALCVREGVRSPLSFRTSSAAVVLVLLLASLAPTHLGWEALAIAPIVCLIMSAAQRDRDRQGTFFAARACVQLGEASYCFYLVHSLVQRLAVDVAGREPNGAVAAGLFVCVSTLVGLLAAAALHVTVERPLERRLRTPRAHPHREARGRQSANST